MFELIKVTWKLIVDLFAIVGININMVLLIIIGASFFVLVVPSLTGRIAARTSGRLTRSVRSATTPYYGKKGTGIYKNPSRSVKNKVYRSRARKVF